MSDLQRRTEQLLRSKGFLTGSVERRKSFPAKGRNKCRVCGQIPLINISVDLWNVFDLVAIKGGVVFVQVTSAANHSTRRKKILASAEAKLCVESGCDILIQSWRKKDNRWQSADEWITIDQFVDGLPDTVEEFYEQERKKKLPDLPPGSTIPFDPDCAKDLPF